MQLGFDRQHFALPVPANFFELNKSLPVRTAAYRQVRVEQWILVFELLELPVIQGRRFRRGHYTPSEASVALPVQSAQGTLQASKC
ncbi:hypothetical protein ALO77_100789 [Pseudomonas coronafaciens pv. garcae]|uniref:Uncharacterized protein n=1 Tax=Pseudomonas coronafaciens pv. garcae TaxID=251653 RepID=A0AB37QT10_9PSED|nr:hypothetical protein ALO77_100789 [Pseudomonas coronafaciens pv. garcae]RMS11993.1 hypothetical protein ALP72_101088 [Pseudomonas coronafaciens pv. coronafaciens]RMT00136.1 hypothetical protein ALP56_100799 [Pseudomonas coronafaciens pv. oryzae]RMW05861.1 hypothetical protein ALO99_100993 [Pseudomonas coronafaciens pv. porri]RMS03959.1 hypothetical protein ALP74_100987 [Pseudomonas coronafaciens pv. garcae]